MKRRGLHYDFWTKSRVAILAHIFFSIVLLFFAFSVLIGGYIRFDGGPGQYLVQAGAPEGVRVKAIVWWVGFGFSVSALLALPIAAISMIWILLHKLCAEEFLRLRRTIALGFGRFGLR